MAVDGADPLHFIHYVKEVSHMSYFGGNSFALIVVLFILLIIVGAGGFIGGY